MTASGMTEIAPEGRRLPYLGGALPDVDGAEGGGARPRASRLPRLSLRLEPDRDAASRAREALDQLEGQLDRAVLEDMRLLVTELITNSVRHAHAGKDEPVQLEVAVSRERVRVVVEDAGGGFVPRSRDADSPDDSGWGLHLVERVSERWGVHSNGRTRVWLELLRSSQAGED